MKPMRKNCISLQTTSQYSRKLTKYISSTPHTFCQPPPSSYRTAIAGRTMRGLQFLRSVSILLNSQLHALSPGDQIHLPKFARCRSPPKDMPVSWHPSKYGSWPPLARDSENKLHTGIVAYPLPLSRQKSWNFPYCDMSTTAHTFALVRTNSWTRSRGFAEAVLSRAAVESCRARGLRGWESRVSDSSY